MLYTPQVVHDALSAFLKASRHAFALFTPGASSSSTSLICLFAPLLGSLVCDSSMENIILILLLDTLSAISMGDNIGGSESFGSSK